MSALPPDLPPDWPLLTVLHLEGGGCGGCALEVEALRSIGAAALRESGLQLVDTPRHADLLLVSGTVTRNLAQAVEAAWAAMAEPKWLLAVGACVLDGGPFRDSYAVAGGIASRLPVALAVPGCPPSPADILDGLRQLVDALRDPAPPNRTAEPEVSPADAPAAALLPAEPSDEPPAAADPAPPPGLLPAAPRRPLAGGDGSAG